MTHKSLPVFICNSRSEKPIILWLLATFPLGLYIIIFIFKLHESIRRVGEVTCESLLPLWFPADSRA
jgi:hypothetical protein